MPGIDLDTPYELAADGVDRFRRDGFVHLRDVLSAETLEWCGEEITAKVVELNTMHLPLEERSTYHKAFLQVTKIWTQRAVAHRLVFSHRLAFGPLSFASGSHHFPKLRDLSIGDDSERLVQEAMEHEHFPYVQEPFALGDVSFHYGLTFHRAPANRSDRPRRVITVIYMDRDIEVAEPLNENQRGDLDAWLPGARIGEPPDGPLIPVLCEHSCG